MKTYSFVFLLLSQLLIPGNSEQESDAVAMITPRSQRVNAGPVKNENIVFRSVDGGQTWQDISEGLPVTLQSNGVGRDDFFTDRHGLYIRTRDGIYHNEPNSTVPIWTDQLIPDNPRISNTRHSWILAHQYYRRRSAILEGANAWVPGYVNLSEGDINTIFESGNGSVFMGCSNGIYRSTDGGTNWKQVHGGGWAMKLVESDGVLMATSQKGILRSTDGGISWNLVINEGGVGIEIECINGGFAAITYNTTSMTRRVRASYDRGATWQPIDAGLPANFMTSSIVEAVQYYFCGHPDGIFRSSDKGKTWSLILPSVGDKIFTLRVSGNVVYAIPTFQGC